MPFTKNKLRKADETKLDTFIVNLTTSRESLEEIFVECAEYPEIRVERLKAEIAIYNGYIEEATNWCEEIAAEIQETIDGRSEEWAESEWGEYVQTWCDSWNEIELMNVDEQLEITDETTIDDLDFDAIETLENVDHAAY